MSLHGRATPASMLRHSWMVVAVTFSVGQKEAADERLNSAVLAEINDLSDSLGHVLGDKAREEIKAVLGSAMGNWKTDDALEKTIRESGGGPCNVKRLTASEVLSKGVFDAATEPLVFRSAEVDKWKALKRPWTRAFLRDTYGRSKVMPRSPQVLAHMVPDRKDNGGTLQLKQFAILDGNKSIFDRSWMNASQFEEEDDLFLVDELWDDEEWSIPSFFEHFTDERGMAMGPSGQGFPFHQQGEVWQVQVAGKKLWMLHPARGLPKDWEIAHPRNIFEKALAREGCPEMLHCLLEPGDILFLPRFWHHATLNVGDSIGVGGNRDVWALPDEEVLALAEAERGDVKERNVLVLDLAAVVQARQKKWKDALKDSKLAHMSRPTDPYVARRFAELLLAVKKNTSAAQVVDRCINRTLTLHSAGWMENQEMSGILTLVAHPIVANSFGFQDVERLTRKALALVNRAWRLDSNNWASRIMAAQHYLLLNKIEMSFDLLHDIPKNSMAVEPAVAFLTEMCYEMPDEYKHLEQRFCGKNWQAKFGKDGDDED